MIAIRITALLLSVAAVFSSAGFAAAGKSPAAKVDLADTAAGIYSGDVISDARGSSRSGVTITVTKVGPGTVKVASDYKRLPEFTIKLTKAMQTIQQTGTSVVFLLDLSKSPRRLDITVDDASWSGTRN
jgi:hypothetical protein